MPQVTVRMLENRQGLTKGQDYTLDADLAATLVGGGLAVDLSGQFAALNQVAAWLTSAQAAAQSAGGVVGLPASALTEQQVQSMTSSAWAVEAASLPAASPSNAGVFYLVTDENGGTQYRSNGTSMVKQGPGRSEYDVQSCLWADRGTGAVGQRKRITDLGNLPVVVEWDGARWQPANGIAKIYRQAGVVSGTAGTSSTATSATVTVPGGLLGLEGGIVLEASFSASASPTAATPAASWDGSALFDGVSVGTKRNVRIRRSFRNIGSEASQIVNEASGDLGGTGTGSGAVQTFTKNTANNRTLQASCVFTHASSITATLHAFDIWWVA